MLANHNCAEAFWVGNLKNRDLQVSPRYTVHCCTNLHSLPLSSSSLLFLSPLPLSSSSLPFLPLLAHRVRRSFHRPPSCSSRAARQTMKTRRYVKLGTNGLKNKGASCHFASLWNQSSQAFAIATSSNARGSECLGTWLSSL